MLVKNSARMALERKLVSYRQAGWATADNGDFFAGAVFRFGEYHVVSNAPFANIVFDCINADIIFHLVAVTAAFAWCRANTAHHGGEGICVSHTAESIFLPTGTGWRFFHTAHNIQIATNVLACWAAALAGRGA